MKLKDFKYRCVKLTPGHWQEQRSELIETYLSIDDGDYLHYFKARAGLQDSYAGLEGWYEDNASTFGQILGAFAKLYLTTGDERIYRKAIALADGWGECARASQAAIDGYSTYVYDKLMTGFLDMYEYLHYGPAKDYIRWLTESADQRFDKNVSRDGLQIMDGGMIEWYTLPEQLLRAYALTGEELYKEFAAVWDYDYFWDRLNNKEFDQIGPRHAYSHVNALSSAAMFYITTGEDRYLTAIESAYEEILENHTFATGGYGPAECLFAQAEGFLGDMLKANWDEDRINKTYRNFGNGVVDRDDQWGSCEVSCCAWAVFKICNYMLKITGEAKYGDWAERMLINGTGGQIPITREGQVMYYADYFINGGCKSTMDGRLHPNGILFEWQCCTGTFPEDVAEYANMLYYKGGTDIYVSQYLPSRLTCTLGEQTVCLENLSLYPKEKNIRFVVHTAQEYTGTINFRVPAWATRNNCIYVNGVRQIIPVTANEWAVVQGPFKDGDEIILYFEWPVIFKPVDGANKYIAALCYGPLVMACNKMSLLEGDMEKAADWLEPIQKDGYSFAFRSKPGHVVPVERIVREFYPYYEIPEGKWYFMYNRFKM